MSDHFILVSLELIATRLQWGMSTQTSHISPQPPYAFLSAEGQYYAQIFFIQTHNVTTQLVGELRYSAHLVNAVIIINTHKRAELDQI